MAINSITLNTSGNAPQVHSKQQPEATAPQARKLDAPKPPAREPAKAPVHEKSQVEAPRPVVNTQGQKTGTIVNTTA